MNQVQWWEYLDTHWDSIRAICLRWTRHKAEELEAARALRRPWLAHVLFDAWFNAPDDRAVLDRTPGWWDLVKLLDEEVAIR